MGLRTYANSKASGEPAHPRSLARSFALCLELYQGLQLVKVNSKASGVTARMRSRAWSSAVCICPKAHFVTKRLKWLMTYMKKLLFRTKNFTDIYFIDIYPFVTNVLHYYSFFSSVVQVVIFLMIKIVQVITCTESFVQVITCMMASYKL